MEPPGRAAIEAGCAHAELPSLPLPLLLSDAPGLLLYRPRRLREKLDALRDLLPAADLLRLVRRVSPSRCGIVYAE